jgi:hypothetical protein
MFKGVLREGMVQIVESSLPAQGPLAERNRESVTRTTAGCIASESCTLKSLPIVPYDLVSTPSRTFALDGA